MFPLQYYCFLYKTHKDAVICVEALGNPFSPTMQYFRMEFISLRYTMQMRFLHPEKMRVQFGHNDADVQGYQSADRSEEKCRSLGCFLRKVLTSVTDHVVFFWTRQVLM